MLDFGADQALKRSALIASSSEALICSKVRRLSYSLGVAVDIALGPDDVVRAMLPQASMAGSVGPRHSIPLWPAGSFGPHFRKVGGSAQGIV